MALLSKTRVQNSPLFKGFAQKPPNQGSDLSAVLAKANDNLLAQMQINEKNIKTDKKNLNNYIIQVDNRSSVEDGLKTKWANSGQTLWSNEQANLDKINTLLNQFNDKVENDDNKFYVVLASVYDHERDVFIPKWLHQKMNILREITIGLFTKRPSMI